MDDFIIGSVEADVLNGSDLPDTIVGLAGNDTIAGGTNDDILTGNAGLDVLSGDDGNDLIAAGRDDDVVNGGAGDDFLAGNIGADVLVGDDGNDFLFGGQDDDILVGGAGNDTLTGDFGINVLRGDGGADVFLVRTDVALNDPNRLPTSGQFLTDAIVDFNGAEGDKIALTDGLTESNLVLQPFSLPLQIVESQFISEGLAERLGDINLDPNGDGLVEVTFVRIVDGPVLTVTLNATSADLSGNFISV
ncbi:MAG: hypothetical protein J7641_14580 [Cyanobacteria bacterium SID2]|nr:hypothetical protein [Cyanobacteria bacterium SID2]MBP0005142.1 hypothetical protein [Cyanobacteria bacterium SBC]